MSLVNRFKDALVQQEIPNMAERHFYWKSCNRAVEIVGERGVNPPDVKSEIKKACLDETHYAPIKDALNTVKDTGNKAGPVFSNEDWDYPRFDVTNG